MEEVVPLDPPPPSRTRYARHSPLGRNAAGSRSAELFSGFEEKHDDLLAHFEEDEIFAICASRAMEAHERVNLAATSAPAVPQPAAPSPGGGALPVPPAASDPFGPSGATHLGLVLFRTQLSSALPPPPLSRPAQLPYPPRRPSYLPAIPPQLAAIIALAAPLEALSREPRGCRPARDGKVARTCTADALPCLTSHQQRKPP